MIRATCTWDPLNAAIVFRYEPPISEWVLAVPCDTVDARLVAVVNEFAGRPFVDDATGIPVGRIPPGVVTLSHVERALNQTLADMERDGWIRL